MLLQVIDCSGRGVIIVDVQVLQKAMHQLFSGEAVENILIDVVGAGPPPAARARTSCSLVHEVRVIIVVVVALVIIKFLELHVVRRHIWCPLLVLLRRSWCWSILFLVFLICFRWLFKFVILDYLLNLSFDRCVVRLCVTHLVYLEGCNSVSVGAGEDLASFR